MLLIVTGPEMLLRFAAITLEQSACQGVNSPPDGGGLHSALSLILPHPLTLVLYRPREMIESFNPYAVGG